MAADHLRVVVYIPAGYSRKLQASGVEDIPKWVRQLVRDSIEGMREPQPIPPDYAESAE